jgi:hypothetical protein
MYGRDALLEDNLMAGHRGPMAFGLLLQEERDAVLRGNARGNTIGVLLVAAAGATLEGNEVRANGVGVLVDRAPLGSAAEATSVRLRGQAFVGNAADLAVADEDAALRLGGNAFDRAPPLDLDGDGVIDLPFVATSAFAARAARQPDLMLLAFGPGIALWQRLEATVPGMRAAAFADPAPRLPAAVDRPAGGGREAGWLAVALALARGWSRRGGGCDGAAPRAPEAVAAVPVGVRGRRRGGPLAPLDLRVEGGVLALLGANGAGKSTLLALMAGRLAPTYGTRVAGGRACADARGRPRAGRRAAGGRLPAARAGGELLGVARASRGVGDRGGGGRHRAHGARAAARAAGPGASPAASASGWRSRRR